MDTIEDYFFDAPALRETFETDNRALAFEKFNACAVPCELTYRGEFLAAKEFEEDELTGEVRLVDELVVEEDEEYAYL